MMLANSNLCIFATDGHELISVQFIYTVAAYLRAALSQEPHLESFITRKFKFI